MRHGLRKVCKRWLKEVEAAFQSIKPFSTEKRFGCSMETDNDRFVAGHISHLTG